ncbi:MAG: TonB family protein [Bdellovibrionota bacterium]
MPSNQLKSNLGWLTSIALHGLVFFLALLDWRAKAPPPEIVEMTFIDRPIQAKPNKPIVPRAMRSSKKRAKAVYGVAKDAISLNPTEKVKEGNTLNKAPDNDKLEAGDPTALPTAEEDYTVSQMPELITEIRIPYPPKAKELRLQGAVVMDLLIDDSGKVRDVKLVSVAGEDLDEAALNAIKEFKFRPAKIEDKPVAVKIRYSYRFVLER